MDDPDDRAERGGRVGEGCDRGVVGDVRRLGGHLVALAAQLLGHRLQGGLVVVGEQQVVADRRAAADRDADASGADEDGDFSLRGRLTDATGATPPANCGDSIDNRPVLLVRSVTPANPTTGAPATPGAWFAAGIIAPKHGKGHDRD